MDRRITYHGSVPQEVDFIGPQRNAMVGLAGLSEAVLGNGPTTDGLDVVPTTPTSLAVEVRPGQIYSRVSLDAQAYGSLPADTAHTIVKQGVQLDPVRIPISPPTTPGYTQIFLIQAAFQEVDAGATVLPYYNSQNPAQPWAGPSNSTTQQYTSREGRVAIQVKAGTPVPTGQQIAPTPDPGWVGLAFVSVSSGQAVVNALSIQRYSGSHRIVRKLPALSRIAGAATTVVTTARQLSTEDAGIVILDCGAFTDQIILTLPRISDAPGEPMRFRFVGRYLTARTRRSNSWARIQAAPGDVIDEPWIYCGPNDTVEIVSTGIGRWVWAGHKSPMPLTLIPAVNQTIPHGVSTVLQWQPPPSPGVTMQGWTVAGFNTLIRAPTHSRYRFAGCVSFATTGPGLRQVSMQLNGLPATGETWPWVTGPGDTGLTSTSLNFTSGGLGLVDGDLMSVAVYQNSGVPLTIDASRTWFAAEIVA